MVCKMNRQLLDMETLDIVTDYTAFKLGLSGYNNWRQPTEQPTPAMRTMRLIGRQFEDSYTAAFEDMTISINVNGPDVHDAIINISSVLFNNGIRWGRLVGLIVLAAKLSLKAMEENVPHQVDNIVGWTADHLKSPVFSEWIIQHHGWAGFVQYYEKPENQNNNHGEEFSWTKACSLGIATIAGAAAAFHLFVQKS